jgi:phytoene synthase
MVSVEQMSLADSYRCCESIARTQAANFYHAFRLLPRKQRLAMCALYAFLRISDDIADAPSSLDERRARLREWREGWAGIFRGEYTHAIHPALADIVSGYSIPPDYLEAALDGVGMDLDQDRYETFEELYRYCYRVAGVVGLSCIHIWGFRGETAKQYAEWAGIAFQLTNILRDLREDVQRDRIYLPAEELRRFGYSEDELRRGVRNEAFARLMEFQTERAADFYRRSEPLAPLLPPPGRAVFLVMHRTYRGLLEAIVRRRYDVFSARVRRSRWWKLWQVLRVLPVRWGWVREPDDCRR